MSNGTEKISDERLAKLADLTCALSGTPKHWETSDCHICERRILAREAIQARRARADRGRELQAMREDRNLWQEAHDEDCPNKTTLETVEEELRLQKGANFAQDEREREAAKSLNMIHTCDWPDEVANVVMVLRAHRSKLAHIAREVVMLDQTADSMDVASEGIRPISVKASEVLAQIQRSGF